MSSRFDIIAQQFLQKPFSDCSITELQQLAEAYPYLAPAQFLLAKKLQGDGAPQARALVQKAALYYHQPASFDAFLNSDFDEAFLYADDEAAESLEEGFEADEDDFIADDVAAALPVTEETLQPQPVLEMEPLQELQGPTPAAPEPPQEEAAHSLEEVEENLGAESAEEFVPAAEEIREPQQIVETAHDQKGAVTTPAATGAPAEEVEIFSKPPMPPAAPVTAEPFATTSIPAKEENINNAPALVAEAKPLVGTESLPAFEPFHTVDYFASQGIRLSQEEATKDKMGKQLKSFTEWLKTMKRIPATEQIKVLDPHAEKKVENLAAHSVTETEIVTEAMAEVWLKQGALEKAAAVYQKLSLAHPSKKEYFGQKLENLRQTARNQ